MDLSNNEFPFNLEKHLIDVLLHAKVHAKCFNTLKTKDLASIKKSFTNLQLA